MINQILFYAGSAVVLVWGVGHLFPTRSIVKGFGDISPDNKRIITMEWIVEGAALIFIAALISCVTIIDHTAKVSIAVYWLSFVMLNTLSIISLMTGFKINFLPFKLCPILFTGSSILILLGVCL